MVIWRQSILWNTQISVFASLTFMPESLSHLVMDCLFILCEIPVLIYLFVKQAGSCYSTRIQTVPVIALAEKFVIISLGFQRLDLKIQKCVKQRQERQI
jgi:hypothetical protein